MDSEFIPVADSESIPDEGLIMVRVRGTEVCIARHNGEIYATSNICTHIGGRMSEGKLAKRGHLVCPEHGAIFNVTDGRSLSFPRRGLKSYPVRVSGGKVFIGRARDEMWRQKPATLEDTT